MRCSRALSSQLREWNNTSDISWWPTRANPSSVRWASSSYEDVGILRSLAVTSETRGSGLGTRLVEKLFGLAREEGLRELYLLTTTAEHYFPRFGFGTIPHEQADPRLRASREFQDACPASAICMRRAL